MSWYTIKRDKADEVISEYIRLRDGRCRRCEKPGYGPKGIYGLQASHYYSRRHENTRFDPDNLDALCAGCHSYWEKEGKEEYKAFKIAQLGQQEFDLLNVKRHTYKKKDRKMELLIAKQLLKSL